MSWLPQSWCHRVASVYSVASISSVASLNSVASIHSVASILNDGSLSALQFYGVSLGAGGGPFLDVYWESGTIKAVGYTMYNPEQICLYQHEPDCKKICKYTLLMNIIEVEKGFAFTCML